MAIPIHYSHMVLLTAYVIDWHEILVSVSGARFILQHVITIISNIDVYIVCQKLWSVKRDNHKEDDEKSLEIFNKVTASPYIIVSLYNYTKYNKNY